MSFVVCEGCPNPDLASQVPGAVAWIGETVDKCANTLSPLVDGTADFVGGQRDLPDDLVGALTFETDGLIDLATSAGASISTLRELNVEAAAVAERECRGNSDGRCPSADAIDAIVSSMVEAIKIVPREIEG
jgi:hypothetical protein